MLATPTLGINKRAAEAPGLTDPGVCGIPGCLSLLRKAALKACGETCDSHSLWEHDVTPSLMSTSQQDTNSAGASPELPRCQANSGGTLYELLMQVLAQLISISRRALGMTTGQERQNARAEILFAAHQAGRQSSEIVSLCLDDFGDMHSLYSSVGRACAS